MSYTATPSRAPSVSGGDALPVSAGTLHMPDPRSTGSSVVPIRSMGRGHLLRISAHLLALEPRFDLAALIEDELLLALPLVPMHEVCPVPVRMSAGELPDLPEEKKPNPFAALGALKGRTSDH